MSDYKGRRIRKGPDYRGSTVVRYIGGLKVLVVLVRNTQAQLAGGAAVRGRAPSRRLRRADCEVSAAHFRLDVDLHGYYSFIRTDATASPILDGSEGVIFSRDTYISFSNSSFESIPYAPIIISAIVADTRPAGRDARLDSGMSFSNDLTPGTPDRGKMIGT
ncbi:hypothetical protein EVAR_100113_1 [Eumeta japonica]|uniref:Uncharacterized protein n=1 Tax=Eumeta variegata TaxID=151549 RepID=A0A4C1YV92_EUMVA|nr:hypothetical protein EVAR_100113_1 [Eumeta japonica]